MGTRLVKGVLSGPSPDGTWFWRPADGGESQAVPDHLVEPDWSNAQTVEMQVRRKGSKAELLGPPDPEPDALLLVDGEPYVAPDTIDLEPGAVVVATIPYGGIEDRVDPTVTGKNRPAVVVRVEPEFVVVRAVYSRNTAGRGQRLKDSKAANLDHTSVLDHDELPIPKKDVHELVGTLADVDRRWVLG